MADSDISGRPTFIAGFEFARRQRDPDFRAFLDAHGWRSGQHVVIGVVGEAGFVPATPRL